jgi:hypothetical protein
VDALVSGARELRRAGVSKDRHRRVSQKFVLSIQRKNLYRETANFTFCLT